MSDEEMIDMIVVSIAGKCFELGLHGYDHICPTTIERTVRGAYEVAGAIVAQRRVKNG